MNESQNGKKVYLDCLTILYLYRLPLSTNIYTFYLKKIFNHSVYLQILVNEINFVEVEDCAIKEKCDFDTSAPYSSLKRPVSSPLKH